MYFLILIVHSLVEFGTADLTQHLGENLRSVAICCFFVAFFVVFFTFRLEILESGQLEEERDSMVKEKGKGWTYFYS